MSNGVANSIEKATYQKRAEMLWHAEINTHTNLFAPANTVSPNAKTNDLFPSLFSKTDVQDLVYLARSQSESSTRCLAEYAVMKHMQHLIQPYDDPYVSLTNAATIRWNNKEVSLRVANRLLAIEEDSQQRHTLEKLWCSHITQFNHIQEKRLRVLQKGAQDLGYATYYQLCNELRGLRLLGLQCYAEQFLVETAERYFQEFAKWRSLFFENHPVTTADMIYLMRGKRFDPLIPHMQLETAVVETAERLGVYLTHGRGLNENKEKRDGNSPRPFCTFTPYANQPFHSLGGHQNYRVALHALGHWLHESHIDSELPFITRHLGDNSVREAYALLIEHLLASPVWFRDVLNTQPDDTFISYINFINLLTIRYSAVKLLYEIELYQGYTHLPEKYVTLIQKHLGWHSAPEYYLFDLDNGFVSAQHFRAWMLTAQLIRKLQTSIGQDWMTSPATSAFLKYLWNQGSPPAEMITILIGEIGLTPNALIAQIQ